MNPHPETIKKAKEYLIEIGRKDASDSEIVLWLVEFAEQYAELTQDQKQQLFNYMKDEHGVTLLESDMHEIELIIRKI